MRKRTPLLGAAEALTLVRSEIDAWNRTAELQDPLAIDETSIGELWWAWAVGVQSARYLQNGEGGSLILGLGPYLVDKFTREVIQTGTGTDLHGLERERGYRSWWRRPGPRRVWEIQYVPIHD